MSGNVFELRKDWPVPPAINTTTTANPKLLVIKVEPQDPDQPNPNSTKPEQCRWGPNCPICKNAEEDWDREHQKQLQQADKNTQTNAQQKYPAQNQNVRPAQVQNLQHTKTYQTPQNQPSWTQSFDVSDN